MEPKQKEESKQKVDPKLLWERAYPFIFGAITALLVLDSSESEKLYAAVENSIGSVIGVASIFVGFLATAMSILITLGANSFATRLKEAGVIKRILGYLWVAVFMSLLVVAFSITLSCFEQASWFVGRNKVWYTSIWSALLISMALASYRSIRFMYKILSKISDEID